VIYQALGRHKRDGVGPSDPSPLGLPGPVQGGQRPAQRTLDGARQAQHARASGAGDDFRRQPPSPSGGKDCPALGHS
jgi:hypothetical protein